MNTGIIVTMIVGVLIPPLVSFVTREALPTPIKEGILLLLSTAAGVISGLATSPPGTLSQWEHVVLNILVTFVTAEAAHYAGHKSGTLAAIHRATDPHVGIGPKPAEQPKAA